MDRFIDENNILNIPLTKTLKSNMDRFIGLRLYPFDLDKKFFKIQYG